MKKDSKKKLATSYGKAMYDASAARHAEKEVFTDIKSLQKILSEDEKICKLLGSPLLNVQAKLAAVSEIAEKLKLNQVTASSLMAAAENNRLTILPEIMEAYTKAYYVANNILQVKVSTALELSAQQDKELKEVIEKKLNKKVEIKYAVKPELLGGLVVEYDSIMVDDSIKGKLEKFKLLMKGTK